MMHLVVHLYRQVMRRGRLIGLTALVSTIGLILWLSAIGTQDGVDMETFHASMLTGGVILTLSLLIITVAVLRDEKDEGTLPFIYMRPIPRPQMAVAAIVAGMLAALTLALIAWIVSTLGAMSAGIGVAETWPALILFAAAGFGYAAVFVPLGYLAPRALMVGLIYVVILESIIAQALPSVAHLSIWRIAVSIYAHFVTDLPSWLYNIYVDPLVPGLWAGLTKLIAVALVGGVVLTWALRRRDAA